MGNTKEMSFNEKKRKLEVVKYRHAIGVTVGVQVTNVQIVARDIRKNQ